MEKVGQYLRKEKLSQPSNLAMSPLVRCVAFSSVLKESKVLYPPKRKRSLLQLQEALESALRTALNGSVEAVGQSLQCSVIYHLFTLTDTQASLGRSEEIHLPPKVCQYTDNSCHHTVTLFTSSYLPCPMFYVLRQPTDVSLVEEEDMIVAVTVAKVGAAGRSLLNDSSHGRGEEYSVLDMGKYDQDTLTLLLASRSPDGRPALLQFSLASIPHSAYTTVNTTENIVHVAGMQTMEMGSLVGPGTAQPLDNMRAQSLAVSLRKTAVVLFHSRRRVRILMMEEEEEEEMDDTQGPGDESSMMQRSVTMRELEAGRGEEGIGDEDKENTGMSSGPQDTDTRLL